MIAAVCGLVAMGVTYAIEWHRAKLTFAREAEALVGETIRDIESKLWILKAARAYFAGSVDVEADEFSVFVSELRRFDHNLVGVCWAPFDPSEGSARITSTAPADSASPASSVQRKSAPFSGSALA